MKILPVPQGVSSNLYERAMGNVGVKKRLTARKLMLSYGRPVAQALQDRGEEALKLLVSRNGRKAAAAMKLHGTEVLDYHWLNGPIVLDVLPHFTSEELRKVKHTIGEANLYWGEFATLRSMLDRHKPDTVKRMLASSPSHFKTVFDEHAAERHGRIRE